MSSVDQMPPHAAVRISRIQESLLTWFETGSRHFPWRVMQDPYAILVAEKLLQQTAARDLVVETYNEFIRKYPTLLDLAAAPARDLEAIIRPLGFTYRAHEMKALAQAVFTRHDGQIPDTLQDLLTLPGIGEYSARAVLCFAFGRNIPVVDTNVARFLYRVFGLPGALPSNPARKKNLVALAETLMPPGQAKRMNLAILDLCASICKPVRPACDRCPIRQHCLHASASPEEGAGS
jgi:A/G-specific adenine glycosylase